MNKFLLFLAASAISIPAVAADGTVIVDEETSYIYRVISEADATVSSAGVQTTLNPSVVNIPSTITYEGKTYTVVAVGDRSFDEVESITTVNLPETITSIGEQAFYKCPSLSKITINEGVTSIGNQAFALCPMLGNVTLPASLTTIGSQVFVGTSSMTAIRVADGNTSFISDQGALYSYDYSSLIACPSGKNNTFTINSYCSTINPYAFSGAYISGINLGSGITTISDHAFDGSHLEKVAIPGTITNIGVNVFANCKDLIEATYYQGCTSVSIAAFAGCSALETVNLPNGITSIGTSAFEDCTSLKQITIPATVTDLGTPLFNGCSSLEAINVTAGNQDYSSVDGVLYNDDASILMMCPGAKSGSYTIPEGTITIDKNSFLRCTKITDVIIGPDVELIGMDAFQGCTGLKSVTFNKKLKTINGRAFAGCTSLKEIELPIGIDMISFGSFMACISLEKVVIPYTVANIYSDIFSNCFALKEVYCLASNVPDLDDSAFNYIASDAVLYVPDGCKEEYESSSVWSSVFSNITELETINVTLTPENVEIKKGETAQLTIEVKDALPVKAIDTTWHSNNSGVAKVNEDGVITAVGPGTAVVSATVTDNTDTGHIVKCNVTVNEDGGVEEIILDSDSLEIYTVSGVYAGKRLEGLKSGIYVVKQGSKTIKHVVK